MTDTTMVKLTKETRDTLAQLAKADGITMGQLVEKLARREAFKHASRRYEQQIDEMGEREYVDAFRAAYMTHPLSRPPAAPA